MGFVTVSPGSVGVSSNEQAQICVSANETVRRGRERWEGIPVAPGVLSISRLGSSEELLHSIYYWGILIGCLMQGTLLYTMVIFGFCDHWLLVGCFPVDLRLVFMLGCKISFSRLKGLLKVICYQ